MGVMEGGGRGGRGGGCGPRGAGTVLSVAPLMGANPVIDPAHRRWLHIHVRPPVRGLLKVLRGSSVPSMHRNLAGQLVDGHWVLSFPSADAAHYARDLVDQHQVPPPEPLAMFSSLQCIAHRLREWVSWRHA